MTTPQYQCQSWYDGESKSVKDCTCGKCADAIKRPMNTKQIIQNMEKEFDEKFPGDVTTMEEDGLHVRITSSLYNRVRLKAFIEDRTRTLLESFGEEIIPTEFKLKGRDEEYIRGFNDGHKYAVGEQRLKVKEILEVIK